jgi:hypothetical protein
MLAEKRPLARFEREPAVLKALPDIVISVSRPSDLRHLGPWESLDEYTKEPLLVNLVWSGDEAPTD